jgi:hypothetical protein
VQGGKFKVRLLHENGDLASPGEVEFKELPTIKFDSLEKIKYKNEAYGEPKSKSFAVVYSVSFRKSDSEKNWFQITASYKHQAKHKLVKQLVEAVGLDRESSSGCIWWCLRTNLKTTSSRSTSRVPARKKWKQTAVSNRWSSGCC